MYVCVCLAITEATVRESIEKGATTVAAVTGACKAGGDCGACHGMIATMIEDHCESQQPAVASCPPAEPQRQLIAEASLVRSPRAA